MNTSRLLQDPNNLFGKSLNKRRTAAVIGLWHLGCTVSASLAKAGFTVRGFDYDTKLIDGLNHASMPIAEPGLAELVDEMIKVGALSFTADFKELKNYPYIVIGYDTPVGNDDRPDLTVITKAITQVKKFASPSSTVIIMSQVPAGTCRKIYDQLKGNIEEVEVVYNPENLRLSQAVSTYLNADRQILGVSSPVARRRMENFYAFFKNPLIFMSLESAELVKHGVNSFLAMSVSFINQISDIAEVVGADITDVVRGMRSDSRIGQKAFLNPGLGFAGGTLGRDLRVLELLGKKFKVSLPLISDVYQINQRRKALLYKKITKVLGKLGGKKIALFGLVYKPGTNTLRRSLALEVAAWLKKQKAEVRGFDPSLKSQEEVGVRLRLLHDPYAAATGADAVIIITEWSEFKAIDYQKIKTQMRGKIIFDTKNILSQVKLKALGFNYYGTGIGKQL